MVFSGPCSDKMEGPGPRSSQDRSWSGPVNRSYAVLKTRPLSTTNDQWLSDINTHWVCVTWKNPTFEVHKWLGCPKTKRDGAWWTLMSADSVKNFKLAVWTCTFEFESVMFWKKKEAILSIYCHGCCDRDGRMASFFSNYHHASDDWSVRIFFSLLISYS